MKVKVLVVEGKTCRGGLCEEGPNAALCWTQPVPAVSATDTMLDMAESNIKAGGVSVRGYLTKSRKPQREKEQKREKQTQGTPRSEAKMLQGGTPTLPKGLQPRKDPHWSTRRGEQEARSRERNHCPEPNLMKEPSVTCNTNGEERCLQ